MYQLPDGTTTNSVDLYADTWQEFARPLCSAMQMNLSGFGNGSVLITGEIDGFDQCLTLPVWFVQRFNELEREG
jgi:hypothetical protein